MPSEPDVVVVPAGDALLGDPPATVHVNVFAIAKRPVTNGEFAAFREGWSSGPDGHLVRGVSWADAVAYCRWLSLATARVYRLPDEREWEKAARAGVLEHLGDVREWTNTWADGARILRDGSRVAERLRATDDLRGNGFRVVRSMTGR